MFDRQKLIAVPFVIAVGSIIGVAYAEYANSPPQCWVETAEGSDPCAPCTDISNCPACDQGTCPGNIKICSPPISVWELKNEDGYLNLNIVVLNCFSTEGCEPQSGANCGDSTPCVGNGETQVSSTKKSFPLASGACTAG